MKKILSGLLMSTATLGGVAVIVAQTTSATSAPAGSNSTTVSERVNASKQATSSSKASTSNTSDSTSTETSTTVEEVVAPTETTTDVTVAQVSYDQVQGYRTGYNVQNISPEVTLATLSQEAPVEEAVAPTATVSETPAPVIDTPVAPSPEVVAPVVEVPAETSAPTEAPAPVETADQATEQVQSSQVSEVPAEAPAEQPVAPSPEAVAPVVEVPAETPVPTEAPAPVETVDTPADQAVAQAEADRLAAEQAAAEAARLAEEQRKAQEAEAARIAEEQRKAQEAEQARIAEEQRKAQEAEQARQAQAAQAQATPNTYPWGQCTWGVKELAPWVGNNWGNASNWVASAQAAGRSVGTTPVVGAIAVWPYDGGGYGHVAVVTAVNSATSIQVMESNYAGNQSINNYRGSFNPTASTWGGGTVYYIYP